MSRRSGEMQGIVTVGKFGVLELGVERFQIKTTSRYGRPKEVNLMVSGVQEVRGQ